MDTRTQRGYPGNDSDFAALISYDNLMVQLPELSESVEVTFLVIATPISGVPSVEDQLTGNARVVAAAVIDFSQVTDLRYFTNDISYFTDAEAYAYQQKGLQDLYSVIGHRILDRQQRVGTTSPGRVVVLSGDVHYGFTNRLEFWASRFADMDIGAASLATPCHFVLVQLCASALKNEKDKVLNLAGYKKNLGTYGQKSIHQEGYTVEELVAPAIWLGWLPPSNGVRSVGTWRYPVRPNALNTTGTKQGPMEVSRNEYVFDVNKRYFKQGISVDGLAILPDWEYRIDYMRSLPNGVQPTVVTPVTSPAVSTPTPQQQAVALQNYLAAASNSMMFFLNDGPGNEIVGKNNIGEVNFLWGNTEATKFIRHTLWWSHTNDNGTDMPKGPHSPFFVLLGENAALYPKPSPTY